jgi:hypothetical protein
MKLRSFILILLLAGLGLAAVFFVAANTPAVADYAQRYAPPFAIVSFYLFVCWIAIAMRVKRGRFVIYNSAFIFLALAIAELYFHLMPLWRSNDYELVFKDVRSGRPVQYYHTGHPELGYVNQPNIIVSATKRSIKDGSIVYDVTYSIDERGLRKTLPENNNGVLFFGDSITFGEGVNDEDTLPQLFSAASGSCALNFAVSGYGPHHMLREMESGRPETLGVNNPRAIVYIVMPEYVISRAAGLAPWDQRGPRYETINGEVKYLGRFDETRFTLQCLKNIRTSPIRKPIARGSWRYC